MFRNSPPGPGDSSPWGLIDSATPLGPDAVAVSTPSHGGIWVSLEALEAIPEPLRATAYSGGGWFEEDCDWCIPYLALDLHRFEDGAERGAENLAAAQKTLWLCHKDHAGLLDHADCNRGRSADSFPSPTPFSPASAQVHEASPVLTFPSTQAGGRLGALRRRVRDQGAGSLQETEALELLLGRCCHSAAEAGAVAAALLGRFGSIPRIIGATIPELSLIAGDEVAVELALFHDLARQILEFPLHKRSVSELVVGGACLSEARTSRGRSREAFHVLFLDKANQLIADERMGDGTIDHAPVYPREIMRRALELAASACCLVHNHPTGSSTPSARGHRDDAPGDRGREGAWRRHSRPLPGRGRPGRQLQGPGADVSGQGPGSWEEGRVRARSLGAPGEAP